LNEKFILLDEVNPIELWGANNATLKLLQVKFPHLKIVSRGNAVKLNGNEKEIADFCEKFDKMLLALKRSGKLEEQTVLEILEANEEEMANALPPNKDDVLVYGNHGKIVRARTANQRKMVEYVAKNDVVFAIGPAGTGKTYTAVACAVRALKNKEIKRIILARPAVEAGESLGFLPGDLKEKIDPYLRPLYDALDDMIPPDKLKTMLENRTIEIAPMAFMRGRTLDNCYVILDEAQNATDSQLKMFLTRMGPYAKVIVTGDLTQVDLPRNMPSGLIKAVKILDKIKGIKIAYLTVNDVVRHKIVKEIVKAYDKSHEEEPKKQR
jgi:phosphate starvation-inducible protein PhoH and related proteins